MIVLSLRVIAFATVALTASVSWAAEEVPLRDAEFYFGDRPTSSVDRLLRFTDDGEKLVLFDRRHGGTWVLADQSRTRLEERWEGRNSLAVDGRAAQWPHFFGVTGYPIQLTLLNQDGLAVKSLGNYGKEWPTRARVTTDGKLLVTYHSSSATLRQLELPSMKTIRSRSLADSLVQKERVRIELLPDGRSCAVFGRFKTADGSHSYAVRIVSFAGEAEKNLTTTKPFDASPRDVVVSRRGKYLAAAADFGAVVSSPVLPDDAGGQLGLAIWRVADGRIIAEVPDLEATGGLEFSPTDDTLAVGCRNRVELRCVESGDVIDELPLRVGATIDMAFSADGTRLAVLGTTGVQVFDVSK